ncbi:thioesterase [Marinobacterium nitratireducens]|uniref:Thioesterase n=1 Tax=Marinobacterium nitratireducens TaxID=518897 RepID=A0A918DUX1_9GAMM|nr:PaaI family thioesterase [Marinobacterium nitratireducens]GGO83205.1 thioesterase [Marinobacterium nitratireducens]
MTATAFQDQIPGNHCFGCGPGNAGGLQIKSYWQPDGSAICHFRPSPQHCAGPAQTLNGGIIATLIDCHGICTAIADAYRRDGRAIGQGNEIWYATGKLEVSYRAPAPIDAELELLARVDEVSDRKTILSCTLSANGARCAEARVVAVRVPDDWRQR